MSVSEARERVLQSAETLFVERGYEAVTVKDIAQAAGIHHASLYHHIPGGKSDLFIEVMTRNMQKHQQGVQQALKAAPHDLRSQLQEIAAWFLSQAPVDIIRLTNSDLLAIPHHEAFDLATLAHKVTLIPIVKVLEAAQERGEIEHPHLGNIAGGLFAAIEGLHSIPDVFVIRSRQEMANELIDVYIRGIRKT